MQKRIGQVDINAIYAHYASRCEFAKYPLFRHASVAKDIQRSESIDGGTANEDRYGNFAVSVRLGLSRNNVVFRS